MKPRLVYAGVAGYWLHRPVRRLHDGTQNAAARAACSSTLRVCRNGGLLSPIVPVSPGVIVMVGGAQDVGASWFEGQGSRPPTNVPLAEV